MRLGTCPSEQQLREFQQGGLAEPLRSDVALHLQRCPRCEAVIEQLDTEVDPLRATQSLPPGIPADRTRYIGAPSTNPGARPADQATSFPFLQPAAQPDEIGRLGNYRVLHLLGKGGMGFVFRAEDIPLRRTVALKVMKPDLSSESAGWQRFLREARILAAIKHDHLVTVFQVGQHNNVCYFAMELLEGESLADRIARAGRPELREVVRLAREIASGLAVVHRQGLIHRDLKPENIWLQAPDARVKILDFGLARFVHDDSNLTHSGVVMGTPSFMSPEQARGDAVDERSDLFSLGGVLYALCTGVGPFQGDHTMAVLTALAVRTPRPIHELNPAIPPNLCDLVMQLLAKDPHERPPSADAVLERLRHIEDLPHQPPGRPAGPDRTRPLTRERPKRGRHMLIAGLTLALAIVLALAAWKIGPRLLPSHPARNDAIGAEPIDPGAAYLSQRTPIAREHWPFNPPAPPGGELGKPPPPPDAFTTVRVRNQISRHGIVMHPPPPPFEGQPASLSYRLQKKYSRFKAGVSLNDGPQQSATPLTFSVYGDGSLLWQSKPVLSQANSQPVDIPIQNVDVLKIEVLCPGAVHGAHAVWIEPRVLE